MTDQEPIHLTIDKVVPGGSGLGFHAGKAVFVPFTAPGDRLLAEVTRTRSGCLFARCVEILEAGAERVDPACALFTLCGGCQLRHLSLSCQQVVKGDFVRETLSRFPNLRGVTVETTWAAAQQGDGYRCRAGFKVRWLASGLLLGFFQTASHRVADLGDGCPVLEPRLNRLLAPLRRVIGELSVRHRLPQVDAVVGEQGVGLVFHLLAEPSAADRAHLLAFAEQQGVLQVWLQRGRKTALQPLVRREELFYCLDEHRLTFRPGDFIQAHLTGNRLLVQEALRLGGRGARAWDLFCGVGNFTLPLAQQFDQVLGVEGYTPALQRAEANARQYPSARVHFAALDLFQEAQLARLAREPLPDLVLMDPPREGALLLARWLVTSAVRRLVYLSCNPATFARDAAILVHGGFTLQRVQPIDLFPHTCHLELVALFVRP
ncbi:MAG: 23S rRNA (uracil(1939)-C(5))-methyltransferase RlmD [Magnetococcus sp. MYC-9]